MTELFTSAAATLVSLGGRSEVMMLDPKPHRRRALVVAPQPFYQDRGTPIAVRHVLEALSDLGFEVDLLTYPIGRSVEIPGVRVIRVWNVLGIRQVPIGFSFRKLFLDSCMVPVLWRLLRTQGYACVHAVEEAAFPAVFLGRGRGLPVIYDMQSSLPEQLRRHRLLRPAPVHSFLRACERWLLRNADLVMSSAGLAQEVEATVPSAKVDEWWFPSQQASSSGEESEALRDRLEIPADSPVIVYTGTFAPYQGIDTLLAAMPAVCARIPEICLVLVGAETKDRRRVASRAASLGLNGNIRLVERQPRERVAAFLRMADVLVSPRAYGGNLPLKVFDYLAAGRPILATDIPTHRAVLSEDNAILVAPGPEAMADGLTALLRDRALADGLADRARAHAESRHGWMRFVRSVAEAYDEVCA